MLTEYEKLALRLRRGTCQMESTLFPQTDSLPDSQGRSSMLGDFMRSRKLRAGLKATSQATTSSSEDSNNISNNYVQCFDEAVGLLSSMPTTDNSLAFTILECGVSIIIMYSNVVNNSFLFLFLFS